MRKRDILPLWWGLLCGRAPFLSIEITKECPLRCPGCYAFSPGHLGEGFALRDLSDLRGSELVQGVMDLVVEQRPVHVSIVGGEPLVRYRELRDLLPRLAGLGVEVQIVTSAVRPIPAEWAAMPDVHLAVSVDGLPAEHNLRRAPATYERILRNISGHRVIIHCTVTRRMCRPGYLTEFCEFWSERAEARKIWFSLYTPQTGEISDERLTAEDRARVLCELDQIRKAFPKVQMPRIVLQGLARPPASPETCVFARLTTCVAADLSSCVQPCQLGGSPACQECGCVAAAALTAISRIRLAGVLSVGAIFRASREFGLRFAYMRVHMRAPQGAMRHQQEVIARARSTIAAEGRSARIFPG